MPKTKLRYLIGATLGLLGLAAALAGIIWLNPQAARAATDPQVVDKSLTSAKSVQGTSNGVRTPDHGQPNHSWIGLMLAQLNEERARTLGLAQTSGVVVMAVMAGSPADGVFQNKDIINKVGGNPVTDIKGITQTVRAASSGTVLSFEVTRGSQTLTFNVTVGTRPEAQRPKGWRGIKPHIGGHFGVIPRLLPELEGIAPSDLFGHFRGGQIDLFDKDNKPFSVRLIAGTVAAVNDTSITVAPNGGGPQIALQRTEWTKARRTPQIDDRVIIQAVGDEARLIFSWVKK